MEIGVLYLSHAMLVLAELIVWSTKGFGCILAKWFWPSVMSLSLTYEVPRPHVTNEFWALCILVINVSETVMVETIPYSKTVQR